VCVQDVYVRKKSAQQDQNDIKKYGNERTDNLCTREVCLEFCQGLIFQYNNPALSAGFPSADSITAGWKNDK
jgi:hypothetical protein